MTVSTGLAAQRLFFPSVYWGPWPLVAAAVMGLLAGGWLETLIGSARRGPRRFILPALLAGMPPLWLLIESFAHGFPFISGESTAVQFGVLLIVLLPLVSLPLAAMGAQHRMGLSRPRGTGVLLAGAAAGLAAHQALFLGPGAIAAHAGFTMIAILWPFLPVAGDTEPTSPPVPAAEHKIVKAGKDRKPGLHERLATLLGPILAPLTWILILITAVWTVVAWERVILLPLGTDAGASLLAPAVLLALGAGLTFGASMSDTALRGAVLVAAGAGIGGGLFRSFFSDVYIAFYAGQSATPSAWVAILLLLLLPAAGAGLLLASPAARVRWDLRGALIRLLPPVAFVAAGLAVWPSAMLVTTSVAACGALLYLAALRGALLPRLLPVAAAIACTVWVLLVPRDGWDTLFDPSRFMLRTTLHTPAGEAALLFSRDYDDRYHVMMWNQTTAMTQSSRTVQATLFRMGHLPMLLAGHTGRVLVLGIGAGLPLEAVRMHRPKHVVLVEPVEALLALTDSAKRDLREFQPLAGVETHAERPLAYLMRGGETFDVILSAEPFAAPDADASLLTETYYRAAAARLAPRGLFAQWLPAGMLGGEDLRSALRAALTVFPSATLWLASTNPDNPMVGIIAMNEPGAVPALHAERLARLLADRAATQHLQRAELTSMEAAAASFAMTSETIGRFVAGAPVRGPLVLPTLRRGTGDPETTRAMAAQLFGARTPILPAFAALHDSARIIAEAMYAERPAVLAARATALRGDDSSAARALAGVLRVTPRNIEARAAFSDLLLRQAAGRVGAQQYGQAVPLLVNALKLGLLNTYLLRLYMITAMQLGDKESAATSIDGIKRLDPRHAGFRDNQATIRAQQGATNDALLLYENAITMDPSNEEFYCNMASFHFSQNRAWEAIRVLDNAVERSYYPVKPLLLEGMFYAQYGRVDLARTAYERCIALAVPGDPMIAEARKGLAKIATLPETP
jgi:spermidine synthase/tetratricopeptide (TPR) repeat protein